MVREVGGQAPQILADDDEMVTDVIEESNSNEEEEEITEEETPRMVPTKTRKKGRKLAFDKDEEGTSHRR